MRQGGEHQRWFLCGLFAGMSVAAVAATFSLRHLLAKSMTSRTNQGRRANPEDSMNPRSGTSTGDSTLEHRRRKRRHKTSAHGFGSCGIHQGRKPATASDSDLDSSSTESLPDYFCRRQNRDDELIDDLFGTVSELTNPRQSDHPRRPARRPAEKSTFFACGDIMTSSDEELAEGGIQEFYGNQSDLEYSLSNCPVVVCKSSFQASRPCEVSVSVGDSLWMLSPPKPEESSVDTARYLTVVKKSNRHHGIVPTHVLEALGEHNSQTFFHGRDRFAECKDAIERGRQCPHEQTRARVLTKHNGVPIRLPFAVGMAGHDRGRGLFAMEDIPANTVLEKCPFILDDIDKVNGRLEDYVFQLEVTDPSEDEMYAFLQGYGSLYNHSNFPSVDYRLPHQPVDPANTVSHVVEFVARRDIMKGEELTINYGRFYWHRRPHVKMV